MTQDQLAQAAGISRFWLGRWERGRSVPPQAKWDELSRVLKLHASSNPFNLKRTAL
jgi:DNA-binding transcriptional regulator YiaG